MPPSDSLTDSLSLTLSISWFGFAISEWCDCSVLLSYYCITVCCLTEMLSISLLTCLFTCSSLSISVLFEGQTLSPKPSEFYFFPVQRYLLPRIFFEPHDGGFYFLLRIFLDRLMSHVLVSKWHCHGCCWALSGLQVLVANFCYFWVWSWTVSSPTCLSRTSVTSVSVLGPSRAPRAGR
jgi:hypothetical protein